MSSRLEKKEERILQILERLAEESSKGIPIIVEGKKDVETLRTLSIKGKIIEAKTSRKSMLDVISEVETCRKREVILLLDFDRRGRELAKRLKQYLETSHIKANIIFWKRLRGIAGHELKDVEGLTSYMETLKRRIRNS